MASEFDLPMNTVVEVSLRSVLFGQQILTVRHYYWTLAPVSTGATKVMALMTALENDAVGWVQALNQMQVNECRQVELRGQPVYPIRQWYQSIAMGANGVGPGTCAAPNIAGVVTLQTDFVSRGSAGSVHVAGLSTIAADSGLWDVATITALNTLVSPLQKTYPDGVTANAWRPIVWSPRAPALRRSIVNGSGRPEVRDMTRRTVGRGI